MTKLDLYAPHRDAMKAEREQHGGPKHWRSLDHKNETPDALAFAEQEFPHGSALHPSEVLGDATTTPAGFQRRDALKLMGASLALAGIGTGCIRRPEEEILPYTRMPEHMVPGLARYYASAYPSPNGAIGIVVESHEGRPTKIEGNPDHPASQGRANVWMQSHVLELYDPDRSRTPRAGGAETTWAKWDGEALPALTKQLAASGGKGFAILADASGGPTWDRLVARVQQKYPQATVYTYDPLRADNTLAGAELVFGPGARVDYDLEGADVVVSLDSNFLIHGPNPIKRAWAFSRRRSFERIPSAKQAAEMNRLYVVESAFTSTGANADHRLRVRSSEVAGFAKALANGLAKSGVTLPGVSGLSTTFKPTDEKFLSALVKDLAAHRGKAVVIVGDDQPPAVHALGHLINQALGAFGPIAKVVRPAGAAQAAAAAPATGEAQQTDGAPAAGTASTTTGTSVKPHESSLSQLTRLTAALGSGQVDTLLIVGANPVYTSPGALGFADALQKAKQVIHLGLYADETAQKAAWHLPMAHPLETWGDAISWEGVYSPIQPLIQPLFSGRSGIEILAQLAGERDWNGRGLVEETFTQRASGKSWKQVLHDGVADLGLYQTSAGEGAGGGAASAIAGLKDPSGDDLEVVFQPGFGPLDGRYANLGWLQEVPDPMTKVVWGNAAIVSPALATKLGLHSKLESNLYQADVVRIELDGKAVELPTYVLPGVEPNTIVLWLGYGRTDLGEVANGVGVNVYPVLPKDGSRFTRGAKVTKTGARQVVLSTQDHFAVEGRPLQEVDELNMGERDLAVMATVAQYQKDPDFAKEAANMPVGLREKEKGVQEPPLPIRGLETYQLDVTEQPWEYDDSQAWGMTIDLTACIGCQSCVVACQSENNIPVVGPEGVEFGRELHWIRVDRYYTGDVDNPHAINQPVPCMHCENAPCEPVCPVAATVHDEEGLNAMIYNRCIGTRYCANNCPYKVRRFNYFDYSHSGNIYVDPHIVKRQKTLKMLRNPDVTVRYRGVMEKCTYCTQRIQAAKYEAKRRGDDPRNLPDGAVTPACAQTCPTNAIVFGNINGKKPNGEHYEVAKRKLSDRNYEMLSELNVRPRTTFLAKLKNANPELV